MPTTKTCTKCGETKPLDGFFKHRGGKYGVRSACKPCVAERRRRHYEKNRDDIREQQRSYYEANRDYMQERERRYKAENRDIVNAKNSKRTRVTQELTEVFATVPPSTPWTSEEEHFLMAEDGMTIYEKAVQLGRTYSSCQSKLYRLRKKLGVSPGEH